MTPGEQEVVKKQSHAAPCPWTLGAMGAVGLLVAVTAGVLGVFYADLRELRATAVTNKENIREVQTDIRYIRESVKRIEDHLGQSATRTPGLRLAPPVASADLPTDGTY